MYAHVLSSSIADSDFGSRRALMRIRVRSPRFQASRAVVEAVWSRRGRIPGANGGHSPRRPGCGDYPASPSFWPPLAALPAFLIRLSGTGPAARCQDQYDSRRMRLPGAW